MEKNGSVMADEDDEQEQDESPEPEERLFTLTEAERARKDLEPFLVEAPVLRPISPPFPRES